MGEAAHVVGNTVELRVLRQVPDVAVDVGHARVGGGGATDHPQQAGLAGTVAPDQPDLLAGADREAHVLDEQPPGDLDGQPTYLQHARHRDRSFSSATPTFPAGLALENAEGQLTWRSRPSQ